MDRATRNKVVSGTQDDLTSGNACWETAPLVYQAIAEAFGPFDVDVCADAQRNLAPVWFGPDSPVGEFDALTAVWPRYGTRGYGNPPYGKFISKILPYAKLMTRNGFASTFLIPMRVTKAFQAHVMSGAAEVHLCDKRLMFFENGLPRISRDKSGKWKADPAVFDSMIVRYLPLTPVKPSFQMFKVPQHVTPELIERARLRKLAEAA